MNYNKQRIRQQIINTCISQIEAEQQEVRQLGLNDPFQIYYYPTPLEDPQELKKIELKIKGKLIEQANMERMEEIEAEMSKELYIINEQIKVEKLEHESLDLMIKQLEGQLQVQKTRKQINKKQKNLVNFWCQTDNPKCKEQGTNYEQIIQNKLQKQKILFNISAYSINILSQTHIQNQPHQHKHIQTQNKGYKDRTESMIRNQSHHQRHLVHPKHPIDGAGALNIEQIYHDIEKQMRYMRHLKKSKQNRQYLQQKKKVKFLMELFWKNVQGHSLDESSISLPLLQV